MCGATEVLSLLSPDENVSPVDSVALAEHLSRWLMVLDLQFFFLVCLIFHSYFYGSTHTNS